MAPRRQDPSRGRFLRLLRCPDDRLPLAGSPRRLRCEGGHTYRVSPLGIPLLADPPAASRRRKGRGQCVPPEVAEDNAAAYAGMRAFAAGALRRGESEGLYRTVDDLLLRGLRGRRPAAILDVGCGTGRCVVDAATAFPDAIAVGLDRDPSALLIAHAVARLRGPAVSVDLRRWGFDVRTIDSRNLANAFFVRARSERLPFAVDPSWRGFDAVTCVNLLDRCADPERTMTEIARVLAPEALFVLATPLNWHQNDGARWQAWASLGGLASQIEGAGLIVDEAFDGLVYRELLDVRGSATDWQVAVVTARKGG